MDSLRDLPKTNQSRAAAMRNEQCGMDIVQARSQGFPLSSSSDELPQWAGGFSVMRSLPRSTQLVFGFQSGRAVPRLREPRHLYGVAGHASQVLSRWPKECEVIGEKIRHIEWAPPVPEPLCAQTSTAQRPQVTEAGQGILVFNAEAGRKSIFSGSCVGGQRIYPRDALESLSSPDDTTLIFESRFESGNLLRALQIGEFDYELTLRTDLYTEKHMQWFYFRVRNTRAGVSYRFTITNLLKVSSLYTQGQLPLLYSEKKAQALRIGWHRTGQDVVYYHNGQYHLDQPCFSLSWTLCFPYDQDTCYLAHCYPYTYADLRAYLSVIEGNSGLAPFCRVRSLCRSLAGNPVPILTVSTGAGAASLRPVVVLTARVHPGETSSSWVMKGVLDHLLGSSADAALLRSAFLFKLVPMLNPDGVIVGNHRCSLSGRDLNRTYRSRLRELFPTVWAVRAMIRRLLSERTVLLYCDFHGHNQQQNAFTFGCEDPRSAGRHPHERVFPLMLSKNCQDMFSFQSCKFEVQRSKEGTGRVTLWRMGVLNSLTLETSLCGSSIGWRKGTHFNTRDLEMLGVCFCRTLLDYCDPDRTKYIMCLRELQDLIRVEGGPGLADASLSTSDSSSSESDGTLALNNKMSWGTKTLRSKKERNKSHLARVREKIPQPKEKKFQEDLTKDSTENSRYGLKPVRVPPTMLTRDMSKASLRQPFPSSLGTSPGQGFQPELLCHLLVGQDVTARRQLETGVSGRGSSLPAHIGTTFRWDPLSRLWPLTRPVIPPLLPRLPSDSLSSPRTLPGPPNVSMGDNSIDTLPPPEEGKKSMSKSAASFIGLEHRICQKEEMENNRKLRLRNGEKAFHSNILKTANRPKANPSHVK
ncbi:cytosolic carboxypeptidase 2-like [Paramormyrops kingsleyae]|uniref:cytosolic carboxypeptidase 2-like n=1 Tax=Paramormyrops kingsleyae TaxID=1676925 RepID=UPI003B96E486